MVRGRFAGVRPDKTRNTATSAHDSKPKQSETEPIARSELCICFVFRFVSLTAFTQESLYREDSKERGGWAMDGIHSVSCSEKTFRAKTETAGFEAKQCRSKRLKNSNRNRSGVR